MTIEAMKQAEPVAFINVEKRTLEWANYTRWDTPTIVTLPKIPLYTAPPQRQPLTDERRRELWRQTPIPAPCLRSSFDWYLRGIKDAEAAHGIKE